MRKLFYMGLESYIGRYTYQLEQWSKKVFEDRNINYVIVNGSTLDNTKAISVGQVLDAHGRSYFSMTQMSNLVKMMREGEVTGEDVIFFEDMFSPGIESLPYIINQIPKQDRPKIFVRTLAQSIDPDDFVHVCGMEKWMGHYEKMVDSFVTGILATNEEMVAHMKIAGWTAPIYNISGLAFGKNEVLDRVLNKLIPFHERNTRVIFSARFDQEKQPDFFMEIINKWNVRYPHSNVEFAVLSGGPLRSNKPLYLESARKMQTDGKLSIYENLQKNEYYNIVNNSRVLINTALQDWWSNTVNEADSLGCNVLYPAYRSFPETFSNDHERLYIPWSVDDAINKLSILLNSPHKNIGKISDWADGTVGRCIDIMQGCGEEWNRTGDDYRNYVRTSKF
jgi:hypothetical protein